MSALKATVAGIEWDLVPRPAIVQCDECGDQYKGGTKFMRSEERVRLADDLRANGWQVEGDHQRHICPHCAVGVSDTNQEKPAK